MSERKKKKYREAEGGGGGVKGQRMGGKITEGMGEKRVMEWVKRKGYLREGGWDCGSRSPPAAVNASVDLAL